MPQREQAHLDEPTLQRLAAETNPVMLPRLLAMFRDELDEFVIGLKAATEAADAKALVRILHKTKNSAAMFGALPLAQQVTRLHDAIRDGREADPWTGATAASELAMDTREALNERLCRNLA